MEQFGILEQLLDGSLLFHVSQNHDLSLKPFSSYYIHCAQTSHFSLIYEQILHSTPIGFNDFYTHKTVCFIVKQCVLSVYLCFIVMLYHSETI